MTPEDLIHFEAEVAQAFNTGRIRAPIHLSGGNEHKLIDYFAGHYAAARGDWVCTYWRSHYHCLLAGVPPDEISMAILAGRSITLNFPEYRVISSAIVGGVLPIALGLALSIKRRGGAERVHCFLGDMTARTGAFWECLNYAVGHDLPIHFVIEDNGKSVMTDTKRAWAYGWDDPSDMTEGSSFVTSYRYNLQWPHAGAGVRVEF